MQQSERCEVSPNLVLIAVWRPDGLKNVKILIDTDFEGVVEENGWRYTISEDNKN